MIQTGIHSKCFSSVHIYEVFRLIKDLGFKHVDVDAADIGEGAQVDQMAIMDKPELQAEIIRKQADLFGLRLEELYLCPVFVDGIRVEVNNPDPVLRAKLLSNFEKLCQYASLAGFKSIMGVPGTLNPETDEAVSWKLSVDMLSRMLDVAMKYQLDFHVEPHVGSIIIEPEKAVQLANEVPGLRYTLDYAHFIMQGIPQKKADIILDYTGHMHARQTVKGQMGSALHVGIIDFEALMDTLKRRKWDGTIAMEYRGASKDIMHLDSVFQNVALAYQLESYLYQS